MAHLSGGGGKPQPKKSRDMDDWYLLQEEKKLRRQWELEQKRKKAAQKAAEIPLPSGDTATRNLVIDYDASDREEVRQQKPSARDRTRRQNAQPDTPTTPETTTSSTPAAPEPKESGVRNTVSEVPELISAIEDAFKKNDLETARIKMEELLREYPDSAANIKYDDQYALVLMDGGVLVTGNGAEKHFDRPAEALQYIQEQKLVRIGNMVDAAQSIAESGNHTAMDSINKALNHAGAEIIGNSDFKSDYQIVRYNHRIYVMGNGIRKYFSDIISALKYINALLDPPSPPTDEIDEKPEDFYEDEGTGDTDDKKPCDSISEFKTKYGDLINQYAKELGIDPDVLGAIVFTESGGGGFYPNGTLKIRFEAHIFTGKELGGANGFKEYFKHNSTDYSLDSYRTALDGEWNQTHVPGNQQESEYGAFNFAKTLNEDAAYNAISMGFGQIMGFNYSVLGYSSAKDMFNDFSKGELQQIEGMIKFIENYNPKMLSALQNNEYNTFGLYYNGGSGYGSKIEQSIDVYSNTK